MGMPHDGMTIRQLVARMDALVWETARLQREYVRLGVTLHGRLQDADHVVATGSARPAGATAAPRREAPPAA